jgi:hypothetical protein
LGSVRVGRGVARVGTKLPMCIGSGRGPALQLESEVAPRWAQVGWVVRAGLSGLLILVAPAAVGKEMCRVGSVYMNVLHFQP